MIQVRVNPELLRWAWERAGRNRESLRTKFPKLELWERGEVSPTLKQLENFAKATYVPIGYFFLDKPPVEKSPIPDLRTLKNRERKHLSPDLLDTIYICQQRQSWYRDYARKTGQEPLKFVGSIHHESPVEQTAEEIRKSLHFDLESRRTCPTWSDALRMFIHLADEMGVLVMSSSIVGSYNKRKLDIEEFRGFALVDSYAPLVFINGADTKAGQMFTLAHELAHIWLGKSALSDISPASIPSQKIEIWCNRVAAELLVPLSILKEELLPLDPLDGVQRLARRFKVSTLVILRRIFDTGRIRRETFEQEYAKELKRLLAQPIREGGNFYWTQSSRVGKRFARALIASALEGHTLYRDAFQLLGIKKEKTFQKFSLSLGGDPIG